MHWINRFVENNITSEGLIIAFISFLIYGVIVWSMVKDDTDQDFDVMG